MVDLDDHVPEPPRRRRRMAGRSRGSEGGPFLLLIAAVTPLGGALYRIVDLVGLDGLLATDTVGPRLQLLGNAVNPLTGLLLLGALLAAVTARSAHLRMVAGTAVAVAGVLLTVAVAVAVAAVRDRKIFPRTNDAHVEVISYEISSALVALGVIWLAFRILRRPQEA